MEVSQTMARGNAMPIAVARMIEETGGDKFPQVLLHSLTAIGVKPDHCSIFVFDDNLKPSHVGTATEGFGTGAYDASRAYAGQMYHADPLRDLFRNSPSQEITLLRLDVDSIDDTGYRDACFRSIATVDKISIVSRKANRFLTLNLYRCDISGCFQPQEIRHVEHYAPILVALAEKHVQLYSVGNSTVQSIKARIMERVVALGAKLSQREAEVCTLILLGHTSESISLNIGVGHSTVLTYRKRAYVKLQISSANELFRRCMN